MIWNGSYSSLYLVYSGGIGFCGIGNAAGRIAVDSGGPSDDRLKYNEAPVGNAMALIMQVPVKRYMKTVSLMTPEEEAVFEAGGNGFAQRPSMGDADKDYGLYKSFPEVGVVAQEISAIDDLKFIVTEGHESEPWRVQYNNLTCLAVKAIQEQAATIAALEARIVALENR